MDELADRFEAQLWHTVREATACGYVPRIFERMLREHGGVQTAKQLIASGDIQYGFERLAELGRLDITLEQVMLCPEYAPLFTPEELEAARWRLAQVE
ncbi:MAG: hypothetical protein L0241_08950 [Planctomycetia bacterium]|nr:hypothetical protein [Planctomycetia bacterium]